MKAALHIRHADISNSVTTRPVFNAEDITLILSLLDPSHYKRAYVWIYNNDNDITEVSATNFLINNY